MPLWKRCFDICLASLALGFLSPLLATVWLFVRFTSPGPALFTQWRTGFRGKRFLIYKFRTLRYDSDSTNADLFHLNERDGPAFKIEHDPRATPIGHILRASGVDELPQVWNILKGDMSWVGPRPLPCHESAECRDWQQRRHDVVPGLTCFWQIRSREVTFDEWMEMDLAYVDRMSPWLDLKILVSTPAVVFRRLHRGRA